jgi:hypothetical protein
LKVAFQTGVITDHWRFGHIWLMIVKVRGTLNCHVSDVDPDTNFILPYKRTRAATRHTVSSKRRGNSAC